MRSVPIKLRFVFLSALLSLNALPAAGQGTVTKASILNARISRLELTDQTLSDGIAKLSLEPVPLAIGFEELLREKFADAPLPNPRFSVLLENKTVREILDTLCAMDSRYTWSMDGRTVNVFPRSTVGDPSYLLNRKLDKLEIKGITDIEQGLLAIAQQLPPPREQVAIVQVGGDLSYPPQPWTVTFVNLTVRQVINRLARHMGTRSSWVFSGSKDFRAFSFFKLGFHPSSPNHAEEEEEQ